MKVWLLRLELGSEENVSILGVYGTQMAALCALDSQRAEFKRRGKKEPCESDLWDFDLGIDEYEVLT